MKLERSNDEWDRLVHDAKRKEMNWKFLREDGIEEVTERDEES